MKCKGKFSNILAVLLLGFVAVNLSLTGIDHTVTQSALQPLVADAYELGGISLASEPPIVYVFRLLFILFLISPPLIVLLLVLIWKELRDRNKMK
jgi:hypothetical protein